MDEEKNVAEPGVEGDVYSEEGREHLVEDGEMEAWEEGFMEGANMDGQKGKCANCGGVLFRGSTHEKEIKDENRFFCCVKCVEEYEKKHEDD